MATRSDTATSSRLHLSVSDTKDSVFLENNKDDEEIVQERLKVVSDALKTILEAVGEDVEREGLVRTPLRAAKALFFFTKGYEENIECEP